VSGKDERRDKCVIASTWKVRGNLIVSGGIASAEWVLCSSKVVLKIISVDCVEIEMAL